MRKLFIALSGLLLAFIANAREMVPLEGELGIGYGDVFRCKGAPSGQGSFDFDLELRYNLKKVPLAVGLQYVFFQGDRHDEREINVQYGGSYFGPVAEYSWPRGNGIQLICGLGAGIKWDGYGQNHILPYCRPKVAVEIKNHFRVYVAFPVSGHCASGMSVGISAVIGGGPKKIKTGD